MYIGRKGIFMRQEYLQAVAGRIKDKTARRQILEELESHLLDKIDYYTEIGYPPEEAENRAVEEMGDPDDTALPLSTLHGKRNLPLPVVSLVFLAGMGILSIILPYDLLYRNAMQTHELWADWTSLGILTATVALFILGAKYKSKAATLLTMAAISMPFIITLIRLVIIQMQGVFQTANNISGHWELSVFAPELTNPFEPSLYAPVKTVMSGFFGYSESMLAESYIGEPTAQALMAAGIVLYLLLMAWGLFQFIAILRQEHLRNTKISFRVLRIIRRIAVVLLGLNILLTAAGTVAGLTHSEEHSGFAENERSAMIDIVIQSDVDAFDDTILKQSGFDLTEQPSETAYNATYSRAGSDNVIFYVKDNKGTCSLSCVSSVPREGADFQLTDREMQAVAEAGANLSLQDFLAMGFYNKAAYVFHTEHPLLSDNSKISDEIRFAFSDNCELEFHAVYAKGKPRPDNTAFMIVNTGGDNNENQ